MTRVEDDPSKEFARDMFLSFSYAKGWAYGGNRG